MALTTTLPRGPRKFRLVTDSTPAALGLIAALYASGRGFTVHGAGIFNRGRCTAASQPRVVLRRANTYAVPTGGGAGLPEPLDPRDTGTCDVVFYDAAATGGATNASADYIWYSERRIPAVADVCADSPEEPNIIKAPWYVPAGSAIEFRNLDGAFAAGFTGMSVWIEIEIQTGP